MWQFPDAGLDGDQNARDVLQKSISRSTGVAVEALGLVGSLRHQVTRFRIDIDVYGCRARAGRARAIEYGAVAWCDPRDLTALAMPAAHRKIARSML
jgi:adenine-specific DNA glycosylase